MNKSLALIIALSGIVWLVGQERERRGTRTGGRPGPGGGRPPITETVALAAVVPEELEDRLLEVGRGC